MPGQNLGIAPRKILAIKLRALGDTVLMTAPLEELRRAFPSAEIHVAVTTAWAPLLENHPAVDHIFTYDRHKDTASRAKALARLAISLRRQRYDCVVNFHASPSSATLAYSTGARVRSVHFHGHKDKNRHSTVKVPGKGILKPIIERDMDTVRALGVSAAPGHMPKIFLKVQELEKASRHLQNHRLSGPLLAMGIGASRPAKSWPLDRFASIAVSWCEKTKGSTLCLVSQQESALAREFFEAVDHILMSQVSDLQTRAQIRNRIACESGMPIRMLAATLATASVYLGNDSGPKHVAVAVGTPTVTIFGPEDPFEWHPYPKQKHPYVFIENLGCRKDALPGMRPWCGLHACMIENHRCMRETSDQQVLELCLKQMRDGASQCVSETESE